MKNPCLSNSQMVELHYNMINKTKDQLILEDIYIEQG